MSGVDLTVALTAHAETVIAGPTLRSAEAAIARARDAGLRVETILGLDSPTPACRDWFSQAEAAGWAAETYAFRDQGATRNALAERARGRWLAFLDGDDLFSENWLAEAARVLAAAEAADRREIVHPELNWMFDGMRSLLVKTAQDDPLFTPYYFAVANYYDALCMAPRAAWIEHPYAPRAVADGYAYEDQQWNVETMAAGWRHVVARDTVIFKRRRDASQTTEASGRGAVIRAIEPMAVDRLGALGRADAGPGKP